MNIFIWCIILLITFIGLLVYAANWLTRHYTSLHDLDLIGQPRPYDQKGNTAIVMGGGLAGILSARVLFDHYKSVVIIEADDYTDDDRIRPQVPQGAHAHLVLAIATLCLRTLFPSIEDELRHRGVVVSDLGKAMKWFYWGSWRSRCDKDLPFWCCTRPFLDTLVRDMFVHFYGDKVTFLTKRQIQSPILSTDLHGLGITKADLERANDGVHITGSYSNVDETVNPDEFRVVGVKIKKRGIKAISSARAPAEGDNTTNNNDNNDNNQDIDEFDREKIKDSALLTTTLTVQTNLTHTNGVKKITAHPDLNVEIPQRKVDFDEEYVLGDLIVDATGGTSVFAKWCERLWKLDIPASTLKANSMYVSHLFHEPENFETETMPKDGNFVCLPIYPLPGQSNYFGYLMRVENKLWQVTAMGTAGHHVPNTNLVEFIHHLRRLDHPLLHQYVSNAQPVSGESLFTYHPKVYMQRHWDRVKNRPDGIISIGNSSTVFDPMYGQGMSGACVAALALNTTLKLDKYKSSKALANYNVSQSFYHIFKDRMLFPWMLCVVEDSRWEGIEMNQEAKEIRDSFFGQALKYWIRQGMILAQYEPLAQSTAMGIMNMTCSFVTLLYPPLVWCVLKNVFAELLGFAYTPEQQYIDKVIPLKEERELWEISPVLSKEKEDKGLVYDYIIPQKKKQD